MNRKKCLLIVILVLPWIAGIMFSAIRNSMLSDTSLSTNHVFDYESARTAENAFISTSSLSGGSVSSYDATDSLVYFAYSEQTACVDAYNYAGEYQFSIHFYNREKGSISIRCDNNILYVCSKYGNVFVFDGNQLIRKMTSQEGEDAGFTDSWFRTRSVQIQRKFSKIYRYDSSGNTISVISVPSKILENIAQRYIIVFFGVAVVGIPYFIKRKKRRRGSLS